MEKRIFNSFILLLIVLSLSGCFGRRENTVKFIEENVTVIVDALSQSNSDKILDLLDSANDKERADIDRFIASHAPIEHIYVDTGGYQHGKGKKDRLSYEEIDTLTGLIVTTDDVYMYLVDFVVYDKTDLVVKKLWIISGQTEAVENKNYDSKYHFDPDRYTVNYKFTHVIYADYYDFYNINYKLIWGELVEWNDNSSSLEVSSFDKSDINTLSYNEVITKYGKPGGIYDTGSGYHILFYKTSEKGKYTQLFLNDDDTVRKVQYTDDIGYGVTGIKKIR